MIVGDSEGDNNGHYDSGSAYVVFGKESNWSTVDLADIGTSGNVEGFRIDGTDQDDYAGASVSDAGDLNGDGLDDVIVSAYGADNNDRNRSGSVYVIYSDPDRTGTIDLADIGTPDNEEGFRMDGARAQDVVGVSGTGDVNGDGTPDVILRSRFSLFVVFGEPNRTGTIDLADISTPGNEEGFRIDGTVRSVSDADDINGDGYDDIIVSDSFSDNNGREDSGSIYIVFGKASNLDTIDLTEIGTPDNAEGFRIDGASRGDEAGWSVSGAGDINGDNIPDVIVGAPRAWYSFHFDTGIAYVVYGKSTTETIDLANVEEPGNDEGFSIYGARNSDQAGWSVSGAGDFNADGCPDVIVGAHHADNSGRNGSGSAYIIYGPECATQEVDPDCNGTPYDNAYTVHEFGVRTSPTTPGALSDISFNYLICGTALEAGSEGDDTINDHVDIKQPANSTLENTFAIDTGSYAGRLKGRIIYRDQNGNARIDKTEAKLTVEEADLRFLERERWARNVNGNWVKTNPIEDNCNRQADPGVSNVEGDNDRLGPDYLAGENIGTFDYQSWIPVDPLGRPTTSLASFITSCFKLTSIPGSGPFEWYAWVWQTFSVVDGHRHITVGPIHTDETPPSPDNDNPAAGFDDDRLVGFTSLSGYRAPFDFRLTICDNAGAVGAWRCGEPGDPVLHRNGEGEGCYEIIATNKVAEKTRTQTYCVNWQASGDERSG